MTQRTFRRTALCSSTLFLMLGCAFTGLAAPARAADTTAPSDAGSAKSTSAQAMSAQIVEVHGLVQYRESDSDTWHNAVEKMQISQGGELRTGPHSSVTCVIPPDQAFTLDRLGTVRVEEAARNGNKISTDLVMKYGRTHYQIESAGLEHEAKISSPSSTLAVRGTVVSLYDQPPYTPEAISYTGRAEFTYNRYTAPVGQHHGKTTKIRAGADGASQTALDQTVVDPQSAVTRSATDASLISTEVSRGAVLSFDSIANIPVITNGRPSTDAELPSVLPSSTGLDFVLRWTGNANLNLEVALSKQNVLEGITSFHEDELLYPGFGLQNSPSGGHIPFDNRGGPRGGEEFAYFAGTHPSGIYGLDVQSISGVTTSFTLDAFSNGKLLTQFYTSADGVSDIKSTQVTRTLTLGHNFASIVPIPPVPALNVIPNDPAGNPNPGITSATIAKSSVRIQASNVAVSNSVSVKTGR